MATTASVRFRYDRAQIKALRTDPVVASEILRAAQGFARYEAALAPKDTGAGAASIQARKSRAAGAQDVGWDAPHHYMVFQNYGTERGVEAKHFVQVALERYIHT